MDGTEARKEIRDGVRVLLYTMSYDKTARATVTLLRHSCLNEMTPWLLDVASPALEKTTHAAPATKEIDRLCRQGGGLRAS